MPGVRRTREGSVDAVLAARPRADGSLLGAGAIELGLSAELVQSLEQQLARLLPTRRGAVTWYPAEVFVIASLHGLPDGPVRDATLRHVLSRGCLTEPSEAALRWRGRVLALSLEVTSVAELIPQLPLIVIKRESSRGAPRGTGLTHATFRRILLSH